MYTPKVDFLLRAMKLAYRICESQHVNFREWIQDEELQMEMAIHLDSLLEDEINSQTMREVGI